MLGARLFERAVALIALVVVASGGATAQDKPKAIVVPQIGHSKGVTSVAFSPDGRSILSGSWDHTLKLWDAATGKVLRTFEGQPEAVNSVAFSPDGRGVLAASVGSSMKLWDIATGKLVRTFEADFSGTENAVVFSPDGRSVLSGNGDSTLKLWDVAKGRLVHVFVGHARAVMSVAFSPDGRSVLSGSADCTMKLWDATTGKLLRTFQGHSEWVTSAAFSPDGRAVLSASEDGTLKLWDVATGKHLRTFEGRSVAFSPDGRSVLTHGSDATLKLWDVMTGNLVRTFEGHSAGVTSVAFSPDGRSVLSGSSDAKLRLWEAATGRLVHTFEGHSAAVRAVAFSPDGQSILTGSTDHTLKLWNAATGNLVRIFEGHSEAVTAVALSPDGRSVLSGSLDHTLKLWEVATGRLLRSFTGHSDWVRKVAFSPDGRSVLSCSSDRTLKLWDVATGRLLRSFEGHPYSVQSIAFSPDGRSVISASDDHTLRLWEAGTGRLVRILQGHANAVYSVAFSPDGRSVVSASFDRTLKLWDALTGRLMRTFDGHAQPVTTVAFSPDGRSILSGSMDHTLKLWDAATGKLLRTIRGHSDSVWSVAFSPDGRGVISGGDDTTLRLWSTSSGSEVAWLLADRKGNALAITPVGFFNRVGDTGHLVHVVRGQEVLSVEQTFERLYRPDLVEAALRGDLEGKYENASNHVSLETVLDSGPDPQIEHLAERDDRTGDTIRLSVRITDRGGGVGNRIVWKVNGVTQGNTSPLALASSNGPLASAVVTELLKLVSGQVNIVEVTAFNRAGLVATPPFKITIDNFGAATSQRPRMFVLALGVNKYRMKDYRLYYAASDAESFAKALTVVGQELFSAVKSITLTDEQVSEAGIAAAVKEIAAAAGPEDVFVLFLGGHGKSIAGRYYYYPQSLDFAAHQSVEEHAIGQDKWEAWLAMLPVQQSLLLIDTCEGEAFPGSRGTDSVRLTAMAQLQQATGRNIIATSREAAYEGYKGYGVLTYAILEALDKRTSAGDDNRVRVAALADHIALRVPEISKLSFGIIQNPTRRLTGNDFAIGIRQSVLIAPTGNGAGIPKEPTHVLIRSALLREKPAADDPPSRELAPGTQVRAVEFHGTWVVVARDGQKLGYVRVEALARMQ